MIFDTSVTGMPSGWENEPEYGGPEPTWRGFVGTILVIVAFGALLVFLYERAHLH